MNLKKPLTYYVCREYCILNASICACKCEKFTNNAADNLEITCKYEILNDAKKRQLILVESLKIFIIHSFYYY